MSALILALPMARGGVNWVTLFVSAVLGPLAMWLALRSTGRFPLLGILLAVVLAIVGLQLVPLPALLHRLSPGARGIFEMALGPLGLYPQARPITLDLPATALEFSKALLGLSAFVAAWASGSGRRRRSLLTGALALTGPLVATIVLGGALLGRAFIAPRFPFVNPNHLAGLLGLSSLVALGMAIRSRGHVRWLWLLAFTGAVVVLFASLSRGGIAAFLFGTSLFAIFGLRRGDSVTAAPRHSQRAFLVGVCFAVAIAVYLALDPLLLEVSTIRPGVGELKLALLAPAASMIRDYPLLGVGRGAFATAFTAYKTDTTQLTFTHLENEWVQSVLELGVPGGLLLLGTLVAAWWATARRRDLSWTEVGLLSGVATVAAQCLVDFSLELPGVSVPFMVALGLCASGTRSVRVNGLVAAGGAVLLSLAGASGVLLWRAHPLESTSARILMAEDPAGVSMAAREAVVWRPADYLTQATAGARLVEYDRCSEALPWLTRAMLLNPTAPEPHLYAARCLAASGQHTVARREYRLAFSFGRRDALTEALDRFPSLPELLQVVPDAPEGLMALGDLLIHDRPADAAVLYRKAVDDFGEARAALPLVRAVRATGDLSEALRLVRQRTAFVPSDSEAWRIAAELVLAVEGEEAALAEARLGLKAVPGAPALQVFLVERALFGLHYAEARRLAEEVVARSAEEIAGRHLLIAKILAAQGRLGEAIDQARSASGAQPYSALPLHTIASLCERAGRYDDAIAALERAAGLPSQDRSQYVTRLESLASAKRAQNERRLREGLSR